MPTTPRGQVTKVLNAIGQSTDFLYDALGRLTSADGPLAAATDRFTFGYDAVGRVSFVADSEGDRMSYQYDDLDRVTKVTYPDGDFEETTYTHLDATEVRDESGRITKLSFNSVRQPTKLTDSLGRVTTLEWCVCGALKRLIDPLNRVTSWDQDLQSRPIFKTYPDGSRETYHYEKSTSRLATTQDAKGQVRAFSYHMDDALARILYVHAAQNTPAVTFGYDKAYRRLTTMTDGTGVTSYRYHPVLTGGSAGANELAAVTTGWTGATVTYTYDAVGRINARAIDGVRLTTSRDAAGRPASITNALGTFGYTFEDSSNRVTRIALPNGQSVEASYFGNGSKRMLKQTKNLSPGGSVLSQFDYAYDVGGRLISWNQQSSGAAAVNYSLGYDALDQLVSANAPGKFHTYSYDLAGNMRTRGSSTGNTNLTYNILNELQSVSPPLPNNPNKTYLWDAENRLVGINFTGTTRNTRLAYDGMGRCVEISEYDGSTPVSVKRFVWCGMERAEERDASGNVTRRFFAQGEQVGGIKYFYTFDHLGSVREMTDQSGTVRARYDYDPYGVRTKVAGDLEATAGFTGHYFHAPSGLHLALFRAYDAATGRWLSRDPLAEDAGPNYYSYVHNHPTGLSDAVGLFDTVGFASGAAGIVGNGIAFAGVGAGTAALGAIAVAGGLAAAPITVPALAVGAGLTAYYGYGTGASTANTVVAAFGAPGQSYGTGSAAGDLAAWALPDSKAAQAIATGVDMGLGLGTGALGVGASIIPKLPKAAAALADNALGAFGTGMAAFNAAKDAGAAAAEAFGAGSGSAKPAGPKSARPKPNPRKQPVPGPRPDGKKKKKCP